MEVVKDIAAVIGVVLSAASLITLLSKTVRNAIAKLFKKYGGSDDIYDSISKIKTMLERHVEDEEEFKAGVMQMNEINIEFTKTQCRNIIKTIFYKYNDTKVLPLYEKKTLMSVEELYINRLHGNSFAALLLEEMSHWEIDYESSHADEKYD
ncbi:MAG: hypothetical protein J6Y20_11600 [Lachnospiraceae bacterium]|nr:hypothetical protein [Lachnospiraceae bacterium]